MRLQGDRYAMRWARYVGEKFRWLAWKLCQEPDCARPAPRRPSSRTAQNLGLSPRRICGAARGPIVGSQLKYRENRTTGERFVGCTGYPRCRWTKDLPG